MDNKDKPSRSQPEKVPHWKDPKPAYTMIGSGQGTEMFPNGEGTIDALAVIGSLNNSQLEIFLFFRDIVRINYQLDKKYPNPARNLNEVSLNLSNEITTRTKMLMQRNNNIKALVDKKILKKGKRKCYMINPFLLIPNKEFNRHAATWKFYEHIDNEKGITLDVILTDMNLNEDTVT